MCNLVIIKKVGLSTFIWVYVLFTTDGLSSLEWDFTFPESAAYFLYLSLYYKNNITQYNVLKSDSVVDIKSKQNRQACSHKNTGLNSRVIF